MTQWFRNAIPRPRQLLAGRRNVEADAILPQYTRPRPLRLWVVLACVAALACFVYGFTFAVMAPVRMVQLGFPLLVLLLVNVWALPELGRAPTGALEKLFFAFTLSLALWPNYLAIALPGLPWITMMRLFGFPLVLLLLLSVSVSREFRNQIGAPLRATPRLWMLLAAFAALQTFSVALSDAPQVSLNKLLIAQVNWTAMFFLGAWIFSRPGRAEAWVAILCGMALILCVLGLWEFRVQKVLWAGHIPSFLAVDDPSVQRVLSGSIRAGTDRYRVQGTFATALALGEILALTTPFILHGIFGPYRLVVRLVALAALPIILTGVILTDTRLSLVGFLLSCVIYVFFWGLLRWRQQRSSLIAPALVLSFPAIMAVFFAAILLVPRLRVMTIGGERHAASTEARGDQVAAGIPMVFQNPLGHGIGRGAEALGFSNSAGVMTIDTYYLLIALDYGILGFLLFYGMLLTAISYGSFSVARGLKTREETLLIPFTISIFVFFVIKSIYSGVENQPLVYMMLGAISALVYRQKNGQPAPEPTR